MSKTIGLKQLAQKQYDHVELDEAFKQFLGLIEDAFDMLVHGETGNGKSNLIAMLLKQLLKKLQCKSEYVAYEEGHAFTIQETLVHRHNILNELGNVMQITDHLTYEQLKVKMARRKSAKIWVIDSIQAAKFTADQCAELKRLFVLSRKKKILIYISWAEGRSPQGATAKAVEYLANIKIRVQGYIAFPKSRYGGNKPFVIWEGDRTSGAKGYWGDEYHAKSKGLPNAKKKAKNKTPKAKSEDEPVTSMKVLPPAEKPVFKEPVNNAS